jgi:hypothetical protein
MDLLVAGEKIKKKMEVPPSADDLEWKEMKEF